MRQFRTTDILTTAAAGLALALASRPRSPHSPTAPPAAPPAAPSGCTSTEPAPGPRRVLRQVDGSHTGPALVLLREKFRNPDAPAPALDALSQSGIDSLPPALTQQPAETVMDHTNYADLLRSTTETVMALAFSIAEDQFDCDCGGDHEPDGDIVGLLATRVLIEFALDFEEAGRHHATTCAECAALGEAAPRFVRARYCRDIADDLMTNFESENLTVTSLPATAALDVAASIIDSIEANTGVEPGEVIDDLAHGLAMATAHVNGLSPFGEPEQA